MCSSDLYVDIVPLDPIIFPNIHAAVNSKLNKNSNDQNEIEMVEEVYKEQKLLSENIFLALAGIYKKNEGWVKKLPFPCIYLEDDLVVIRDALHRIRVFLLHKDFVDIACPKMLIEFLSRKFPDCREFLNDMNDYYSFLIGQSGRKLYANNLYRRLHQFMTQMISDASTISLESHKEHLGITVGIITRNRAEDLKDVLGSLTRQIRMPDEVLIVDNGSTDKTCSVIEEFRTKLPISYYFSKEASIPGARNMVVDKAKYEIISFTDDDCITEPGWLDSIERAFLRAENIGVVGGWVKHWPSAKSSIIDTYYGIFHNNTT